MLQRLLLSLGRSHAPHTEVKAYKHDLPLPAMSRAMAFRKDAPAQLAVGVALPLSGHPRYIHSRAVTVLR